MSRAVLCAKRLCGLLRLAPFGRPAREAERRDGLNAMQLQLMASSARAVSDEEDNESFYSCDEVMEQLAAAGPTRQKAAEVLSPCSKRCQRINTNRVSQYIWLQSLLRQIVEGRASTLAEIDGRSATPLFVIAGGCPNSLCGMQAMMYCTLDDLVDFWWVKPRRDQETALEPQTLIKQTEGPHQNTPGRARQVYEPVAQKFRGQTSGDFSFGVDEKRRAFIQESVQGGGLRRMLVYFVWQESWSGPLARRAFLRGKVCYQKEHDGVLQDGFFARHFEVSGGQLSILGDALLEEETLPSMLLPDDLQGLAEGFH